MFKNDLALLWSLLAIHMPATLAYGDCPDYPDCVAQACGLNITGDFNLSWYGGSTGLTAHHQGFPDPIDPNSIPLGWTCFGPGWPGCTGRACVGAIVFDHDSGFWDWDCAVQGYEHECPTGTWVSWEDNLFISFEPGGDAAFEDLGDNQYLMLTNGLFTCTVTVGDEGCFGASDGEISKTLYVVVGCRWEEPYAVPSKPCPGQLFRVFANLECGGDPTGSGPTWKLQGNEEGSEILSQGLEDGRYWCRIRAGDKEGDGRVTVEVTHPTDGTCKASLPVEFNCTNQSNKGNLSGGGCCGGGQVGHADVTLGSVDVRWRLGAKPDGTPFAPITLRHDAPDYNLAKRLSLAFLEQESDWVDVVYDAFGIRQVATEEFLIDLVDISIDGSYDPELGDQYELRYYQEGDFEYDSVGGVYELVGAPDPFVTWVVWNTFAPNDETRLVLEQWLGAHYAGQRLRYYEYEFTETEPDEQWDWTLTTRNGDLDFVKEEKLKTVVDSSPAGSAKTYTEFDGSVTTAKITEEWREIAGEEQLVRRAVHTGIGQDTLDTLYAYHSTGELGIVVRPNGSWTAYSEDDPNTGDLATIEGLQDAAPPVQPSGDPNVSLIPSVDDPGVSATIRRYSEEAGVSEGRVTSVKRFVGGSLVSRTTYAYDDQTETDTLRVTETQHDPSGNLARLERRDLLNDERLLSVWYPDGRFDEYIYQDGGSLSILGAQFSPGTPGSLMRILARHGTSSNGTSGVYHTGLSTQDGTVRDQAGRVRLEEIYVCADGTFPTSGTSGRIRSVLYSYEEELGRLWIVQRSDSGSSYTEYSESGCCTVRTDTDIDGTVLVSSYDDFGRLIEQTKEGLDGVHPDITTSYSYVFQVNGSTGALEQVTTEIVDEGGANELSTETRRDLAGRVIRVVDSVGLTTTYGYDLSISGGLETPVVYPGGYTEITEYYRDGRIESVSGTAVVARYYEYGAAGEETWTKEYVGSSDNSSPRWTKTYYDALGRVKREERPAFDDPNHPIVTTYTYSADGRLQKVVTTYDSTELQAPTLYEYDALGNVERTGLDLNGNDALDDNSKDRINESVTRFVQVEDDWWRETSQISYLTNDSATATTTGVRRERLSGFGLLVREEVEVEDVIGNVTRVTTTVNAATKTVTETTDLPATDNDATRITRNGLLQSTTDRAQLTTTFGYDGFGRQVTLTDARGNITETHYNALGQVDWVEDGADQRTTYAYDETTGRLLSIMNDDDQYTRYAYSDRGEVTKVWGDVPQPVIMIYDDFGQRTGLVTYRDDTHDWDGTTWPTGADPNDGDRTSWTYDDATGLLTRKEYAYSEGTDYNYAADGRLLERAWARLYSSNPLTTTYAYYSDSGENTGELKAIDYADATPDVAFEYRRTGAIARVRDAVGWRTMNHDEHGQKATEVFDPNSLLPGKIVTTDYDYQVGYQPPGQQQQVFQFIGLAQTMVGVSGDTDQDYDAIYTYNNDTARLTSVKGPALPNNGAVYTYKTDSPLIDKIEYKQNSTVQARITRAYEAKRRQVAVQTGLGTARITRAYEAKLDLLKSIQNEELLSGGSPVTVSKYTYAHDVLNRRTSVVRAGSAFAASHHDAWGYNERNELTSSDRYNNTDPNNPTDPNHALDRAYDYDPIGNRKNHTEGAGSSTYYCVNQLNQYDSLTSGVQCPPGQGQEIELFDYDEDGNITQDDTHDYTWDAENRLIRVEPKGAPQNGDRKLEFIYAYLGRRVERTLSTYSASAWSVTDRRRFIYYNWLCLAEYSVDGSGDLDDVLYKYTWGLDLGGSGANPQIDTAGGIGGLLACRDVGASKNYFYFYDGNGNVGQLVDRADGSIDAKYEYDAYGATIAQSGPFADDNPYRLSTKYFDDASSLYYYGYRYYSPRLGRWLNRDPIEERGSRNLYRHAHNKPSLAVDPLGLDTLQAGNSFCCTWRQSNILGGEYVNMWQEERTCAAKTAPQTCCLCCRNDVTRWLWRTELLSASRGACCWCELTVKRADDPWWLFGFRHTWFEMRCTDGTEWLTEKRGRVDGFCGQDNIVHTDQIPNRPGSHTVSSMKVDCACAKRIMGALKKQKKGYYVTGPYDCSEWAEVSVFESMRRSCAGTRDNPGRR